MNDRLAKLTRSVGAYSTHRYFNMRSRLRPGPSRLERPIVSFTFDDFPASAAENGARILARHGARGTFYASAGQFGEQSLVGMIADMGHVDRLVEEGHEIGDHSYDHRDTLDMTAEEFEASILENRAALKAHRPDLELATLAFPFGHAEIRTERVARKYYACARTGWKGINHGRIDLARLRTYPLGRASGDLGAMKALIDRNRDLRGWLIFFTHDVDDEPSNWGCTPRLLEDVIAYATAAGSTILNIRQARELLVEQDRAGRAPEARR